jgi:hypothetical protein
MKKLPPTLLLALGLEIVVAIVFAVWFIEQPIGSNSLRMNMAYDAAIVVSSVLGIAGLLELARRTTGRESLGLRIAAGGYAIGLAIMAFWQGVVYFQPHWDSDTYDVIGRWAWFVADVLPILGVAIACSQRHRTAALAGLGVLLVGVPLPPLARSMYGWIGGWKAAIALQHTLHAGVTLAVLVLAARLAGGESPRAPDAATAGLRTVAIALWLRVIAAVTVAGLTLLMVVGKAGEGSAGILKLAMMSGAIVSAISLILFARGALGAARSGIADLPRWPFVASAAGTLWCLGVGLYQLPYTYRMLYSSQYDDAFAGNTQDILQALSLAVPLVALGAIAIIATAIAGFAARRGLDQLRAEAQGKGTAFVLLMLTSVGVQSWLLPDAGSVGSFGMFTLAASVAALVATVQMARLCALAADSLHAEAPLPRATVV